MNDIAIILYVLIYAFIAALAVYAVLYTGGDL